MNRSTKTEKLLWSIALPGFGQFLNGQYVKGIVLILLEFLISVNAKLNIVIMLSFHGKIDEAISLTNYQWLMFYPCIYMFAIWDAYKDDNAGIVPSFLFLPFVTAAFLGTIGVIYSTDFTLFGILLGPIWLPIICLFLGTGLGFGIRKIFNLSCPH